MNKLMRKLDAFRRLQFTFKDFEVLSIVINASAWNNGFRNITVDDMMKHTLNCV